jgi:hypothetical protein
LPLVPFSSTRSIRIQDTPTLTPAAMIAAADKLGAHGAAWHGMPLDIGHGFLARPGVVLAQHELGSARDSEGPSRAQNSGPLWAKSSPSSARFGPLARDIIFWPAMDMGSSKFFSSLMQIHWSSRVLSKLTPPRPRSHPPSLPVQPRHVAATVGSRRHCLYYFLRMNCSV